MSDENEVMSTTDRLIYMAHQIARNLVALGEERAVSALAEHLNSFWDPRMKSQIVAIARDQPSRLSPMVTAAVARIAQGKIAIQSNGVQCQVVNEAGHCEPAGHE